MRQIVTEDRLQAFGKLFDRYLSKIYNKCLIFVASPDKADDLTHDIFIRAFINLKEIDDLIDFKTWLYSITYKMCLERAHIDLKQNSNAYWEIDEAEESRIKVFHCNSEQQLLSIEVKKLELVLKKLHPEDRVVLLMKYQDSMDLNIIAEQLNISVTNVQTKLNRALERAVAIYEKLIKTHDTNEQPRIAKSL